MILEIGISNSDFSIHSLLTQKKSLSHLLRVLNPQSDFEFHTEKKTITNLRH